MHCLQEKNNTTAAEYHIIFGFAMQSKAMLCQARISKAMPDEAYQSFANKGKPYYDNDETLFGVHAQVSFVYSKNTCVSYMSSVASFPKQRT